MFPYWLQKRFHDWILGWENMRYQEKAVRGENEGSIQIYSNMLPDFPGLCS